MSFQPNLDGLDELEKELEEASKMAAAFRAERSRLTQDLAQDLMNPCFRCTFVRLESARLEGMTACMKRVALDGADFSGVTFSKAELEILRDEKFVSTKKNAEVCWRALRRAFQPENHELDATINWDAYSRALQIRNRVVHPKRTSDLEVSDLEMGDFLAGFSWFMDKVTELMNDVSTDLKALIRQKKIYRREQPKLGRNEICPCGCGKKVKNCPRKATG